MFNCTEKGVVCPGCGDFHNLILGDPYRFYCNRNLSLEEVIYLRLVYSNTYLDTSFPGIKVFILKSKNNT